MTKLMIRAISINLAPFILHCHCLYFKIGSHNSDLQKKMAAVSRKHFCSVAVAIFIFACQRALGVSLMYFRFTIDIFLLKIHVLFAVLAVAALIDLKIKHIYKNIFER